MAIKLGSSDVQIKMGSGDCTVYLGKTLVYSGGSEPTHDYSQDYLTFVAQESGTFTFTPQNSNVISFSTDNGTTWSDGNEVSVQSGDTVLWKGEMTPVTNYLGIGQFSSTNTFTVEGNAYSLLWGDDFVDQTNLSGKNRAFGNLFSGCTYLTSAENLILQATTLSDFCYQYMFFGCTSLTTTPSLPATTLADYCYDGMFYNCTSLTTAPELLATTLADACYYNMFRGCTSLTTAPSLQVTTLADDCYGYMFYGCTSLTTAPELPATTLVSNCYTNMFRGCTSLTTPPELLAPTLVENCYMRMFYGCSSLSAMTCLATDISASYCTRNWVNNVASVGIFVRDCNTQWSTGVNGIPNGWTDNCTPTFMFI